MAIGLSREQIKAMHTALEAQGFPVELVDGEEGGWFTQHPAPNGTISLIASKEGEPGAAYYENGEDDTDGYITWGDYTIYSNGELISDMPVDLGDCDDFAFLAAVHKAWHEATH